MTFAGLETIFILALKNITFIKSLLEVYIRCLNLKVKYDEMFTHKHYICES